MLEQIENQKNDSLKASLWDQFYQLQANGKHLSPEALALKEEGDRISQQMMQKSLEYAKKHTNIVGYTVLLECLRQATTRDILNRQSDAEPMLAIFRDKYEKQYPDHPYTALVESFMQASAIQPGQPVPDVAALDSLGREVRLSELIAGKVALIHLWATWCGPCRRHGKEMIPLYEAYKDKGFTVVGISRDDTYEKMLNAVERDKYPWINLLEPEDRNRIWIKFGIGNAGGGDFLVDENGRFLSVDAKPEVVKQLLEQRINK
jgi:peroxiredoxin